jgi:hypothetical protein
LVLRQVNPDFLVDDDDDDDDDGSAHSPPL